MIKLSQLILEQKIEVVKTDWSGGIDEPVVTLSNGEEYTLELLRREYEDGYYTYDYIAPEAPGYGFFTVGNDEDPEVMGGWEVYSTRRGIREEKGQQGSNSSIKFNSSTIVTSVDFQNGESIDLGDQAFDGVVVGFERVEDNIVEVQLADGSEGWGVYLDENGNEIEYLQEGTQPVKVTKNRFPYVEFTDGSKNYQVEFDYYDEIDDHGYQTDVLYAGKDQFGDDWTIEAVEDKMSGDVDDYDLGSIERM